MKWCEELVFIYGGHGLKKIKHEELPIDRFWIFIGEDCSWVAKRAFLTLNFIFMQTGIFLLNAKLYIEEEMSFLFYPNRKC